MGELSGHLHRGSSKKKKLNQFDSTTIVDDRDILRANCLLLLILGVGSSREAVVFIRCLSEEFPFGPVQFATTGSSPKDQSGAVS